MNQKVTLTLKKLTQVKFGEELCLTMEDDHFKIYHRADQVGEDLTLTDLKQVSSNATKYNIIFLVDVSQVVRSGLIKTTDAYLKYETGIPMAFLHVLHNVKFQRPVQKKTIAAAREVAV